MITASIQFKTKKDLDTFLHELKKSIESPWSITTNENLSSYKSFLNHKNLSLDVYLVDIEIDTIFKGNLTLGIFNNYLKIMSVTVDQKRMQNNGKKYIEINTDNKYYHYILDQFINKIKSLDSYHAVENKNLIIKIDLHQRVEDIRMSRPIFVKEIKTDRVVTLNRVEINNIIGKIYEFVPPNNIALLLNISKRELEIAKNMFNNKFKEYFGNKLNYIFKNEKLSDLYDYFEHIQTSLLFCYSAVEAFCNIAIPIDYKFEFINNKGAKEIWDKTVIERHLKTSEKLKDHLPNILQVDRQSNAPFWSKFDKIEKIRNNLIHQKTSDAESAKSAFQEEFLKESIFDLIYSGFELIELFCNANTKHSYFPMGISNSDIEIEEVDNFSTYFKKYEP